MTPPLEDNQPRAATAVALSGNGAYAAWRRILAGSAHDQGQPIVTRQLPEEKKLLGMPWSDPCHPFMFMLETDAGFRRMMMKKYSWYALIH